MNCLLISATPFEVASFTEQYKQSGQYRHISVAITGIGLMATTCNLLRQIQQGQYDVVIQAGIAGCFDRNIPLGNTVIVKEDRVADMGVMESNGYKDIFDMGLQLPDEFPYTNGCIVNPYASQLEAIGFPLVNGITVNQVTVSLEMIHSYIHKYNPVTESMEGAALHYICRRENIPFIQLRSISNYVGERDKSKWILKEAINNLNNSIHLLMDKMPDLYKQKLHTS